MGTPIVEIDTKYFSGGSRITPDPDDKRELADLVLELQRAVNSMGGTGVTRKRGTGIIVAGQVLVDVTFATAFTAGLTVRVFPSVYGQNVNCWVSNITLTGCRLNISGILGADVSVFYEAVGE